MMFPSLTIALLAFAATDVEVTSLDGVATSGEVVSIDREHVVLKVDGEDQSFATNRLMAVTPQQQPAKVESTAATQTITLIDGSELISRSYTTTRGTAKIGVLAGPTLSISTRDIKTIRYNQQDQRMQSQWQEILSDEVRGDVVVLRKEGRGEDKQAFLDYIDGVLLDVTSEQFSFQLDGDNKTIPFERVNLEGFVYFHARGRSLPETVCRVIDATGNVWNASEVKLVEDEVALTLASGAQTRLKFEQIRRFDFSAGKIVFLSDLEPVKKSWQPFFPASSSRDAAERLFGYRRDENLAGKPITVGGRTYAKGLAIPSRTELVYRLPADFRKFQATLAVDESQKIRGHLHCKIIGDDRELFSAEFAGEQEPRSVELDLSNVGRLTILVDYGSGFDIGDQLLLGDARVVK